MELDEDEADKIRKQAKSIGSPTKPQTSQDLGDPSLSYGNYHTNEVFIQSEDAKQDSRTGPKSNNSDGLSERIVIPSQPMDEDEYNLEEDLRQAQLQKKPKFDFGNSDDDSSGEDPSFTLNERYLYYTPIILITLTQ